MLEKRASIRECLGSRRVLAISALLTAVVTLLLAWWLEWPRPLERMDERQHRLDTPAPIPDASVVLEQSFEAQHDNLTAVKLLLAVRHNDNDIDESASPDLTLRLLDETGEQWSAGSWSSRDLSHNAPIRFAFSPIPDSAGRTFVLRLEGKNGNQTTVWAYSIDGYPRGQLSRNGQPVLGDLRFETVYRYRLDDAIDDLVRLSSGQYALSMLIVLVGFLPGVALLSLVAPIGLNGWRDPALRLGLALSLSLALLPLAWMWSSQLGVHFSCVTLWLLLATAGLILLYRRQSTARHPVRFHWSWETTALLGILLLGLALRIVAIRDLVLPSWVDSPQHYLISRMMAESGRVPDSYRPWMAVDRFWYHFGYHALTASLHMLGAGAIERIMLFGGQILNGFAPLVIYSGTVLLTGRRRSGLIAAFWVALLSIFPAYFLSWGRYTQLTGLLILPPILGLSYRFFAEAGEHSILIEGRQLLILGLLLGGLFLVHARVWVYALVWLTLLSIGARPLRQGGRLIGVAGRWATIFSTAVILAAPWLIRVGRQVLVPSLPQIISGGGSGSYNSVEWSYLTFGWERGWYALAAAGLLWALWRRKRVILLVAVWVILVFLLINARAHYLINNDTWLISLFVPISICIGWSLDDFYSVLERRTVTRLLGLCALTAAAIWCGLFGLRQGAGVVNDETVLVRKDDLTLIQEAATLLPAEALVAVNGWQWLGENNWAGSDGAYWLLPLTGLQTTMPPIGYGLEVENRSLVNEFNRDLSEMDQWDSAETLELLRHRGVTHMMIGEQGGMLRPEAFVNSPHYHLLLSNGAAWLFELRYDP